MKIAILGFGNVGSQLARLWSQTGNALRVGLRPGSKHEKAARELKAEVLEPALAAESADVIALALPWNAVEPTLRAIGPLKGRIVLDATNPMSAELSVLVPPAGSGALQVAEWSGGARVVKAFNTIGAKYFGNPAFDMLYCGDDPQALESARRLIADTTMRPVNAGPLKNAAYLEQLACLWVDLAVNGRIKGAFGFNLVKERVEV